MASLTCPRCAAELREIDSAERVTLDFCAGCKGLFFDPGEVAYYFELARDVPGLEQSRATARATDMNCPKCAAPFEELCYSALDSLVVDRCTGCGGVWLDQGEVPRLEALSAKLESPGSRMLRSMQQIRARGYLPL